MKANLDEFIGLDRSVDEFRRWALSDWKSPTTRAQLAEYYVRCALGLDDEPIGDWEHVDIYLGNDRIEVKASAHLQPARGGEMKRTSPRFDIKEGKRMGLEQQSVGLDAIGKSKALGRLLCPLPRECGCGI